MRRVLPSILVFLGTLLIVLGLLVWLWVGPQARRAPIDTQSQTVSLGSGTYYDFAEGEEVESDQLRSVLNTESDQSVYDGPDAVGDDIAVYDQTSGLFDDATGTEISYSGPVRIALDRTTALPVSCCDADAEIEGLTVKWPFDVARGEYPVWDGTLGEAVTASFAGEEEIQGLPVYRFVAEIPETDVGPVDEDDPDGLRTMYEAAKTWFVEPVTGRVIRSEQDVHQWVEDPDTGEVVVDAADVSVAFSDETVDEYVDLATADTSQLRLLGLASWLAPLLGVLLLGAGLLVFWLTRERAPAEEETTIVIPEPARRETGQQ